MSDQNDSIQSLLQKMDDRLASIVGGVKTDLEGQRKELKTVQATLQTVVDQAAAAAAMLKHDGDNPVEVKALREVTDKLTSELEAYRKRVEGLENEMVAGGRSSAPAHEHKSLAEFIQDSDEWKNQWSKIKPTTGYGSIDPGFKSILTIPALSRNDHDLRSCFRQGTEIKANVLGSTALGDWSIPVYRQGLIEAKPRNMGFLDRLNRITHTTETYKFKREAENSRRAYAATQAAGTCAAGASAVDVDDISMFYVGQTVRFIVTGGTVSHVITSITPGTAPAGAIAWSGVFHATLSIAVDDWVQSESWGVTAESAQKPYGYFEVEEVSLTMKTLATMMAMTQQRLNVLPQLQPALEQKLRSRFRQNVTQHCLYGDNGADELQGIFGFTGAQTALWSEGAVGDTRLDALLRATETLAVEGYFNVSHGLNPADWGLITRAKNADGEYLYRNQHGPAIVNAPGAMSVDGTPVYTDHYIIQGDFLTADLMEAAELVDQGTGGLAFGLVNDQFQKNEITARYEETMILAILTKYAFILGSFDSQP